MRVFKPLFLVLALLIGVAAEAGAPRVSLRPKPRDIVGLTAVHAPRPQVHYHATVRPKARRTSGNIAPFKLATQTLPSGSTKSYALASTRPVYRSPRPENRPNGLQTKVQRTSFKLKKTQTASKSSSKPTAISKRGSVCGDPRLKGEKMAPIAGTMVGCGVAHPVRIASVDGVILSQGSIMDCQTAKTLLGWVSNSLKPAVRYRGGGVKSLRVPSHYSCRTRSSQPGAKISEHGKGHAIDISSIRLNDGSEITVLKGWKNPKDRRVLEKLHKAACGPFGTVLGPNSDRFHQDHFHFDTARYRGGAYCR